MVRDLARTLRRATVANLCHPECILKQLGQVAKSGNANWVPHEKCGALRLKCRVQVAKGIRDCKKVAEKCQRTSRENAQLDEE